MLEGDEITKGPYGLLSTSDDSRDAGEDKPVNSQSGRFSWKEEVLEKRMLQKLSRSLHYMDVHMEPEIESESVYGCTIAIPQIARSTRWHRTFTILMTRTIFIFVVNCVMQFALLVFVAEATSVMNPLGNQMHLCDFGKDLSVCPGDARCLGPGGTEITKTRIYGYGIWSVRNFVRQSLIDVIPDKEDEIFEKVDPGEYGMENYYCRLLCCFLFAMTVVEEFLRSLGLVRLLWILPSKNEPWIVYDFEGIDDEQNAPLEHVQFQVAGMSRGWKLFTLVFVVVPKLFICHNVLLQGTGLLMDTAGILDQILGAMSLTFIIGIDELVYSVFASSAIKYIMQKVVQKDPTASSQEEDEEESHRACGCSFLLVIPRRFCCTLLITAIYTAVYYVRKCEIWTNGNWVAHDMYLPTSAKFNALDFLFDYVPTEDTPFWSMRTATQHK